MAFLPYPQAESIVAKAQNVCAVHHLEHQFTPSARAFVRVLQVVDESRPVDSAVHSVVEGLKSILRSNEDSPRGPHTAPLADLAVVPLGSTPGSAPAILAAAPSDINELAVSSAWEQQDDAKDPVEVLEAIPSPDTTTLVSAQPDEASMDKTVSDVVQAVRPQQEQAAEEPLQVPARESVQEPAQDAVQEPTQTPLLENQSESEQRPQGAQPEQAVAEGSLQEPVQGTVQEPPRRTKFTSLLRRSRRKHCKSQFRRPPRNQFKTQFKRLCTSL